MEKNLIIQRLELIERLLHEVNSEDEYLYLLGERQALLSHPCATCSPELKGGGSQNA